MNLGTVRRCFTQACAFCRASDRPPFCPKQSTCPAPKKSRTVRKKEARP